MKRLFFALSALLTIAITIPGYAMENPDNTNTKVDISPALIRPNFRPTRKEPAQLTRKQLLSGPAGKQEKIADFSQETLPDYLAALTPDDKKSAAQKAKDWPSYVRQLQKIWRAKANKDILFGLTAITPDNQKEIINQLGSQLPIAELIAQAVFAAGDMPSFTIDAKTLGATPTGAIVIENDTAYIGCTDGSLITYDTKKKSIISQHSAIPFAITALAINKKWFAAGYSNGSINITNRANNQIIQIQQNSFHITSMAISDEDILAHYDKDGVLFWYNLNTQQYLTNSWHVSKDPNAEILFVTPNTNELAVIGNANDEVNLYAQGRNVSILAQPFGYWSKNTFITPGTSTIAVIDRSPTAPNPSKQIINIKKLYASANFRKYSQIILGITLNLLPSGLMIYCAADQHIAEKYLLYALSAIAGGYNLISNYDALNKSQHSGQIINFDNAYLPLFIFNGYYNQGLTFYNIKGESLRTQTLDNVKKAKIMDGKLIVTKHDNSFEIRKLNIPLRATIEQFINTQLDIPEWELLHTINNAFTTNTSVSCLSKNEIDTYRKLIQRIKKQFSVKVAIAIDTELRKYIAANVLPEWHTTTACNIV